MKLFFSVGEPSGDLHGANLIRQLRRRRPDVQCVGYGGRQMADAGCWLHEDLTQLSVMWLLRVITNIHRFWDLVSRADRFFRHRRPDAVVMIDYPGFNWWIARRAKAHGIPVFYYGTPQIWAWARWRTGKMRRLVDHALCKLPFEADWYRERGCNATFVGHPYFDEMRQQTLDRGFLQAYGHSEAPLVTILPGSRTQEVRQNIHGFLKSAKIVRSEVPHVRFVVAAYNAKQADIARSAVEQAGLPIEVFVGRTQELVHLATCCMACSGSVSLELLYHTKPTVILYTISPLAYQVQKFFRKVKYITLVNLLAADDPFVEDLTPYDPDEPGAERVLFPEYLTCEDKSPQIAAHTVQWLTDAGKRAQRIAELARLKADVGHGGASHAAAEYILRQLDGFRPPVPRPHFLPAGSSSDYSRRPEQDRVSRCRNSATGL